MGNLSSDSTTNNNDLLYKNDFQTYDNKFTFFSYPSARVLRSNQETNPFNRQLSLYQGDLFQINKQSLKEADIIILETIITSARSNELLNLLDLAKNGTRLMTYQDLAVHYEV